MPHKSQQSQTAAQLSAAWITVGGKGLKSKTWLIKLFCSNVSSNKQRHLLTFDRTTNLDMKSQMRRVKTLASEFKATKLWAAERRVNMSYPSSQIFGDQCHEQAGGGEQRASFRHQLHLHQTHLTVEASEGQRVHARTHTLQRQGGTQWEDGPLTLQFHQAPQFSSVQHAICVSICQKLRMVQKKYMNKIKSVPSCFLVTLMWGTNTMNQHLKGGATHTAVCWLTDLSLACNRGNKWHPV